MKRKLTPEDVAQARALLRRGRTKTDVAKMFGISRRALGFALDREDPAGDPDRDTGTGSAEGGTGSPAGETRSRVDVKTEPPVAAPEGDDFDEDLSAAELGLSDDAGLAEIDAQIARCKRNQEAAAAEGDLAEQRQQANMIRQFLALRKRTQGDPDAIVIPRDQLEQTLESARKKFGHMLKDRPLLCAHCSRELSVSWARDPLAPSGEKEETREE